jgi:hypothetical protein
MKTVDLIGLMDHHHRKLTCLFPQSESEIDRSGLLRLSMGSFLCIQKRLGRPAVSSINGKHDDKHFKPNTTCNYPSRKIEKKCAKTQSRKKQIRTKSLSNGKLT